ncbi:MAG: NAD(P)/FAD-dependent oxidoreductase [Desulfuromonadales bacterium]|nr:NAD(P)/FAD-dependent oxidoreductase [Desulfuromonadales bacterium]
MKRYDLIVVGGGPAGMFAAGFAAKNGARVLLLEKNRRCGAKLLITGKGRCNLTNSEPDVRKFAEKFGHNGRALLTALYAFTGGDLIRFFEKQGLKLKIERGGRVFPKQGGAEDVQKVLDRFITETGVELQCSSSVLDFCLEGDHILSVRTAKGELFAERFIVATGGLSYPETGSTGDGYRWATETGHTLVHPEPALVSIRLREKWTSEVMMINLKNVNLSVWQNGKKITERFGETFFTRDGIGGPIVLDMSAAIRDALKKGGVSLRLDMKPAVESATFAKRLERELKEQNNKDFRNVLGNFLPKDMIATFIGLSGINPNKKCHSVTREERGRLLGLFKSLELNVAGCEGFDKAIITSGGVALQDVDMRTMRSKRISNLFFAGEILDLDAPTGGFNLQLCWSTGYLAGINAVKKDDCTL